MDKVIVNNQIVIMRKYVKQAKTHVINKIVKQVKSLEVKKGNDAQITKNKRKMERLLEKVKMLKKMKVDFVSKFALSKSKDWKSLIEQKNVPLQDQCLALLANHTSVQKEVEKFYSNHSILVDKIPSLIIEWEMKCHNSNKKSKKGSKKKKSGLLNNKKLTNRAEHESNSNSFAIEEKSETENNSSENLELCSDVERTSESTKSGLNCISLKKHAKFSNKKETDKDNETIVDQLNVKKNSQAEPNLTCENSIFQRLTSIADSNFEPSKPKQKNPNRNSQQTKSISFLDLNKIKDLNEIPIENSSIPTDKTEHLVKPKMDSFFITSDGYSESIGSEKGNSIEGKTFTKQDISKRGSDNRRTFSDTNEKFSKRKDFSKPPYQRKNNLLFGNRKTERSKNQNTDKTLFRRETSKNSFPSYQNDNKASHVKKNAAKSNETLHPSWEAKRKLKECAKTRFKGKRTVFEE